MDTNESQASAERSLRDLCRQLARTHGLSQEQAEELYTHMEDKAHAYTSGDETLSGEDLVLLVREHFGDPSILHDMFASRPGAGGLANFLSRAWPSRRSTDIWGTFHFPWLNENRVLFPLLLFIAIDLGASLIFLFCYYIDRMGWNMRPGHLVIVHVIGVPLLLGCAFAVLFYAMYSAVAKKLRSKRAALRRNVDLETEGILVRGALESPAIIQAVEQRLLLTPLVGEPLSIPLSTIQAVQERRSYNGTRYFGDNAAFDLEVGGHKERIGLIVPRPGLWRTLFHAKA